jgi:outer membrane protein
LKRARYILFTLLTATAVAGQAAELKVGVVSFQRILEKSPQAEGATKRIEGEFRPREKAITEKAKELRKSEERLEKDGAIMSEAERQKLDRDIVAARRDIKRDEQEFKEDLNRRQNEELQKLQRRVVEIVRTIGKEGAFDVILTDGVLYFSERVDITDTVMQRMATAEKESPTPKTAAPK